MNIIDYDYDLLKIYSKLFKIQSCSKIYSIIEVYVNPIRKNLKKAINIVYSEDYEIYYEDYYDEILKYISLIDKIIVDNYSKEESNNFISFEGWDLPDDLFSYIDVRKSFIDIMNLLKSTIEDFYIANGALKYSKNYIILLLNRCNDVFESFENLLKDIIKFKLHNKNTLDELIDENYGKEKEK